MPSAVRKKIGAMLEPGEEILLVGGLHWMVYRWPAILFLYGVSLVFLFLTSFIHTSVAILPFGLIFAGMLGAAVVALRRVATAYVLTNRRLILAEGFVGAVTRDIELAGLGSFELSQDALARRLDYGRLDLQLATGRRVSIRPLSQASKFHRWMDQLTRDQFLSQVVREERAEPWKPPHEVEALLHSNEC